MYLISGKFDLTPERVLGGPLGPLDHTLRNATLRLRLNTQDRMISNKHTNIQLDLGLAIPDLLITTLVPHSE